MRDNIEQIEGIDFNKELKRTDQRGKKKTVCENEGRVSGKDVQPQSSQIPFLITDTKLFYSPIYFLFLKWRLLIEMLK